MSDKICSVNHFHGQAEQGISGALRGRGGEQTRGGSRYQITILSPPHSGGYSTLH